MGHYTILTIGVLFKKETPIEILEEIRKLHAGDEEEDTRWWRNPLGCYQGNDEDKLRMWEFTEDGVILHSWGELKNYESDIEKFIAWIVPYVQKGFLENGAFAHYVSEESKYDDEIKGFYEFTK